MPNNPLERLALALVLAGACAFAAITLAGLGGFVPVQGYELSGGEAYPVDPANTKAFIADLERYQGKSGVLLYELGQWWNGLWQGRALGGTLFAASALMACALVCWARLLPPLDSEKKKKRPPRPNHG